MTDPLKPGAVAVQILDCESCGQVHPNRCKTKAGVFTQPHVPRWKAALNYIAGWEAQRATVDRLTTQLADMTAQRSSLSHQLDETTDALAASRSRVTALEAQVAALTRPPVTIPDPPAPTPVADRGPADYRDLAEFLEAHPAAPQDPALYVPCPVGVGLEEAFMGLPSDEHMLLIRRDQEVPLDTADGFRADGVGAVAGANNTRIPVVSRYRGQRARTWFAMARARRGIAGLGPGSRVVPTRSAFTQPPQIEDTDKTRPGYAGRVYWNTAGALVKELVGAQEKAIDTAHPDGYYANFVLEGLDYGGVAYSGITMRGGTVERVGLDGAWRGFSGEPNGETGALAFNGGRYLVSRCATSPLDAAGRRVGPSPIMVNNSPGGRWEHGDASMALAGMPTIWRSSGRHEWVDVVSRWGGPGVNLEECLDGFEFVWNGGICWPNRGGKGGHPAPDGVFGNSLHVSLQALGRAALTLTDVDLDTNVQPGKLCVQLYGTPDPSKVKITSTNGGKPVPVVAYGQSGPVALAS